MAAKRRGLGKKGLDALLSDITDIPINDSVQTVDVDLIRRSQYQPRTDFDKAALAQLADSIRTQGVLQPIVVRSVSGTDEYEIIVGERRWRAAQLVGLHAIPVVIKDVTDGAAMCMALVENIQREDLNVLEEARALERLIREFGMTHAAAADAVGHSRSTVTNLLRLLDLDAAVKELLRDGKLNMGHARALLALPDQKQAQAAQKVIKQGLSVRATEKLVNTLLSDDRPVKETGDRVIDPDIHRLQDELSGRLGASVKINHRKPGRGRIEIQYHSVDELQGILQRIK